MAPLKNIKAMMHRFGVDIARWPRRPDTALDWALDAILQSRDINCVIDIGGNLGDFGRLVRALGYKGRIISFEPSPSVLPNITAAAARDKLWEVRPIGLSAEPGEAQLRLHSQPELDSLLVTLPGVVEHMPFFAEVGTATVRLSTLADEYPSIVAGLDEPRVLLKLDTQGHDAEILLGAKGIPPGVVAVLVELAAQPIYAGQPRMTRVMDILMDDEFIPVTFQPFFSSAEDNLRVFEFDGLFMRPAAGRPEWGPNA